ncbi:MAG: amino acid adenylation domain-containing protein [Polyangiaceae bacterium]
MLTRTLHELLSAQAARRPEATAVVMGGERLSYGELSEQSARLANALRDAGCGEGDRVCLFLPKSPRAIVAMLATLKAGCAYVPIDVKSPPARAARIVETCAPSLVLGAEPAGGLLRRVLDAVPGGDAIPVGWLSRGLPAGAPLSPAFSLAEAMRCPPIPSSQEGRGADPAHILFTSGSTGEPKGVVITHDNVLRFVEWANRYFGVGPEDRVSGHSPLHFDLSTYDVYGAFAAGAELHLVSPEMNLLPHELARFIRRAELTSWFSVPAALSYMAKMGAVKEGDFPSLRRVMWCGEVLPTPVLVHWMKRVPHATYTNLYGPTEATIASSYHTVTACPERETEEIPIGQACDGEGLLVLNERMEGCAPGQIGDLYISGAGLSPGYFRDPAKTAAAFVTVTGADGRRERLYRTGDLAKVGEDGLVYFVGRADTQVKCRGHRVELGEIEHALGAVEGLSEHAVVAIDAGGFEGATICCAFVPAPGKRLAPAALRAELARLLPGYMLPSRWLAMPSLPRNDNGKIDRPALKGRFAEHAASKP